MKIQLIRNATMKVNYAGQTILIDPMLSQKGAMEPFAGIERNPIVDLPIQIEKILENVNSVIVTHNHPDHFDKVASDAISKDVQIFCQQGDEVSRKNEGFKNVTPVETSFKWKGITITRVGGIHGSGKILELMGKVSGFVLQSAGKPTIYWVGDSIWCEEVENVIKKFNPDIIITNSGGAVIPGFDPILMDAKQTIDLVNAAPKAKIIAVHMESLDHCTVTRDNLRQMADQVGISLDRLIIPKDGETVSF
ncbi:MAG: MBL fold metallo-hydrolase [Spirochaetes bacterium GWD1_27_9]|nr:MAG: MBL fold metallo-hydrolase [Spirochaetes bacterium GWB1_27_13]OHD25672.1 MAG: MBL fold metallo-hydrolase [Spirochaetes bacterium GWC1_27_15]OHD41626.1 MAG: MBL fold metallo-hydrolase [Spirochaetes bacterium GWD1_27_9]